MINVMVIVLLSGVSATTPHPFMVAERWVSQLVDQRSRRAEPSLRTVAAEDRRDSELRQVMDMKPETCKEQVAQNGSVWIVRLHQVRKVVDEAGQAELDERSALVERSMNMVFVSLERKEKDDSAKMQDKNTQPCGVDCNGTMIAVVLACICACSVPCRSPRGCARSERSVAPCAGQRLGDRRTVDTEDRRKHQRERRAVHDMRVTTIKGMAIVLPSGVSATTPHPFMAAERWVSQSVDQRSRRAEPSLRMVAAEDRRDSELKQVMDMKPKTCKEQVAQNGSVWIVGMHHVKKVVDEASQAELDERSALVERSMNMVFVSLAQKEKDNSAEMQDKNVEEMTGQNTNRQNGDSESALGAAAASTNSLA
eukprot:CAMPEP_0203974016 /NCGR_PEP_ID=MMETSP0359-20131031/99887_1 /ASSEMBLY_ACC=CAM_ASM_000338 /TAXON_ID=268821 /ORGANISM="Scrippsiella Hangoei, Strain SHTV-5" /LENGTH=366 /DNA_ID=CAMNT_0050912189 /DNA_START=235 /DNA_END=1332 /DNA_ORIENTATION=-